MASKHTTSIVDISEIEDDEEEQALAGSGGHQHGQASLAPAGGSESRQRHSPQALSAANQSQGQQAGNGSHLYLYHEDLHPHQRISNLLSSMALSNGQGSAAAGPAESGPSGAGPLEALAPGQQQQSGNQLNLPAIDYYPSAGSSPGATPERARGGPADEASPFPPTTPSATLDRKQQSASPKANLGTLSGVYFPCVQNIFGVILFIRMVWIVGTAGVPAAFTLVFICCCVTLTTSISLSAIATNGIVPAGGPYYMISRSLGPECGGAVGTLFWFGTTVAGAMYITGAVEIMLNYLAPSWGLFGDFQRDVSIMYNNIRVYGSFLLIIVGSLVWIGVKFVSKLAPVALFCVLFSIFSIYAGIFINYNGRSDLYICVLGDRLVTLKNMPYEELPEFSSEQAFHSSNNLSQKLSAGELASLQQLRRTKALCTFDKLRYIYCPNEFAQKQHQQQQQQQDMEQSQFPLESSLEAIQQSQQSQQQQSQPQSQLSQQQLEAQIMRELFRRPPNMSNCDPYFHANRNRIHLERAVPGVASGILFENLKPRFRTSGNTVSYDEGATNSNDKSRFNNVYVDITTSFTILISIYFPSCTGILAGSNRSGDLADAQKSIPRGTISAQLTTSFVYLSCIVLFGSTFNNLFIRDKFGESMGGQLAVTQIAWPHPYVILIGGLLSTLGASLQSLVGAPRILQGIAKDEVIPCFNRFAKLSPRGEPENAIIFTLAISWFAVLIGNLDFIAPILTISLVMCYFFINLACTLHSVLGSPNWRPRFKHYHWSISSLGCFLCLFVMIVSSLTYFIVATIIACVIYKYIELNGAIKEWGDGKQGLALSAAIYNLLKLKTSEPHTKNWRPQLLLFCKLKPALEMEAPYSKINQHQQSSSSGHQQHVGSNELILSGSQPASAGFNSAPQATSSRATSQTALVLAHKKLLTFASQLKAGKGLTLVSSIIEGDFKQLAPVALKARQTLQAALQEERVRGFADVLVTPSIQEGLAYQVQTAGLGGLKHNTVIIGWPDWKRRSGKPATGVPLGARPSAPSKLPVLDSAHRGSFKGQRNQQQPQQHNTSASLKHNEKAHQFIELMRNVQVSQNALLVVKGVDHWPESCDRLGGFIDIWWIVNDGGLLMLLPHLLKQHRTWKSCQLRIFTVAQASDNSAQMREDLSKFLYHLRIEAQVDIVEMNNTEVSDYAYERTLIMEQRSEIINRLNVTRKQSLLLEQEINGRLISLRVRKPSCSDFEDTIPSFLNSPMGANQATIAEALPMVELATGSGSNSEQPGEFQESLADVEQEPSGSRQGAFLSSFKPDETNLRRMQTALTLNKAIVERSKSAKLVIINLPGAPKESSPEAENNYMEFVEIITEKLDRVLLVQNGGREVITIHS